jgi:hypothetical protein
VRFNTRPKNATPKAVTLKALVDTGGSATLVCSKYANKLKTYTDQTTVWTTPAGQLSTSKKVRAQFTIPELHDNKLLNWNVHVTDNLGSYDMIIGRDIIQDLQFEISYKDNILIWDDASVPLRSRDATEAEAYHIKEPDSVQEATSRIKRILDADYHAADLHKVCYEQSNHLSSDEQNKLYELLKKYEILFDGTLGSWNGEPYEIELKDDAKPYHAKAFPIPRIHVDTLKKEVDRLCEIGVLKRVNRSEWAAPTFIIPKKNGSVRFISDFRELNKRIKRKPFPIPNIQDLLLNLEGFQYATSLDLNMGYYHIELNPTSKRYCTIVLPFGKFEYQRLPMGLCNSPDIFQEKVSELMAGLEFIRAYLDDVLCLTCDTYDDHLNKLDLALQRIKSAGLKVNAEKSFFARGELEYLGYWITREGIQPLASKVQAMMNIKAPTSKKELRGFIGLVNYYRDMWVRRSHILAPLAKLTSKTVKWHWGPTEQKAFNQMKKVISREVLLSYPDFRSKFVIHTDASHYQLGAVISQHGKPIAFYSRKLKPEQTRYTTTERELLSIVETLKEYRNILLGHEIEVHTDHKNLTYKHFNTERVIRWRLILEEYGPELKYIQGSKNVVADLLSRMDISDEIANDAHTDAELMAELFALDEDEIPFPHNVYPLSYAVLRQEQQKDNKLLDLVNTRPDKYRYKRYQAGRNDFQLIISKEDKIVVPTSLQRRVVQWYHERLMHPGETRTELTIGQHYYWKGLRNTVLEVCAKCLNCRLNKPTARQGKAYGHLPEKEADSIPWKTCCIDLIGPYEFGKVKKRGTKIISDTRISLTALTMIDPATGWFEIVEVPHKRADIIANLFEKTWLTRYPWPQEVVLDRGSEFMAEVIQLLRDEYGVKRKPITSRNPQANSMVERAHKTLHNLINAQIIRGTQDLDEDDPWTGVLSATRFGMNSTVHTTNRATPAQLVFGRDAITNTTFIADWQYIKERKQRLIHQNNVRENSTRTPYVYQIGDKVTVKRDPSRKHGEPYAFGPAEVIKVNDNGTIQLQYETQRGGAIQQTWNIRNVSPYRG